jgi:hypothetical protein
MIRCCRCGITTNASQLRNNNDPPPIFFLLTLLLIRVVVVVVVVEMAIIRDTTNSRRATHVHDVHVTESITFPRRCIRCIRRSESTFTTYRKDNDDDME